MSKSTESDLKVVVNMAVDTSRFKAQVDALIEALQRFSDDLERIQTMSSALNDDSNA